MSFGEAWRSSMGRWVRRLPGFRDHGSRMWGARSSALSRQWRVIYVVRGDELTVFVLEVNPHDYRNKD